MDPQRIVENCQIPGFFKDYIKGTMTYQTLVFKESLIFQRFVFKDLQRIV